MNIRRPTESYLRTAYSRVLIGQGLGCCSISMNDKMVQCKASGFGLLSWVSGLQETYEHVLETLSILLQIYRQALVVVSRGAPG